MKSLVTLISIAFTLTAVSSKVLLPQNRVIDGDTIESAIPYLVSITENTLHICGGLIYSPGWVVTAASCVAERQTTLIKVTANEQSLIATDAGEETITVFQVFVHEAYDPVTKANDIALLKLASNFTLPPAACIRYDEILTSFGTVASIGGWGTTIEYNGAPAVRLHSTPLQVLSRNRTCEGYSDFNSALMVCTTSDPTLLGVPCTYDEGSPLVMNVGGDATQEAVAVGIFSRNLECDPLKPSVFTRLSAYYAWLINIADRQPASCSYTPARK